MFPFNEYKILRILKTYFTALSNAGSSLDKIFEYLFDNVDIDEETRNALRDVIINDKIQYQTTYSNISTDLPTIVCIMDQETQQSDYLPIGDKAGHEDIQRPDGATDHTEEFGYPEFGVYSINILAKQILLCRLLAIFVKFMLEHYATNNDDTFYDLEINVDRFSPDAEYFPADVMHVHVTARFRYMESWPEIYSLIRGIFYTACGMDSPQYITKAQDVEVSLSVKSGASGMSTEGGV